MATLSDISRALADQGIETTALASHPDLTSLISSLLPRDTVESLPRKLVVEPETPEAVAAIMALASESNLAVLPVGGGTRLATGYPPDRLDVILLTRKLKRVTEYVPANLTVSVEAGLTLAELNQTLFAQGQFLPLGTPLPTRSTLGGIVAANSSGAQRLGYGGPRDLLIGSRFALSTGKLVKSGGKVVKNVAGYDLNKLLTGSFGTLGVLTDLTFKVLPRPTDTATLVGIVPTADAAFAAVSRLLRSILGPLAITVLGAPALAALGQGKNGSELAVAVLFGGPRSSLERQIHEGTRAFGEDAKREPLRDDSSERFWAEVADLPAQTENEGSLQTRINVPPGELLAGWRIAERLSGAFGDDSPLLFAHGWGAITLGLTLGMATTPERLAETISFARSELVPIGGSLIVESAPTDLLLEVDPWGYRGDAFDVMRRLKAELDPKSTLSPGRFVGRI